MDLAYIGNNFHNLMLDMGEDYTLMQKDGTEYTGKISIIPKTASSYMLAEREYLMKGTATFPNIKAQRQFRGCYFKRAINPDETYILISTIPRDTTPYVADIYAVGCNAKVSLGTLVESVNEKMDRVLTPKLYAEEVPVYWDSSLQKQKRSADGNFDQTIYNIQVPASYGLQEDFIVVRKMYQKNINTLEDEFVDVRFRVESVDMAMVEIDEDGNVYGIADVQMSLDTRG